MKINENMLNITELDRQIANELDLSKNPISEAAKKNASFQHYYLGLLFREKRELKKTELLYKKVKARSYKTNRWNSDIEMSKKEADDLTILNNDVERLKAWLEDRKEVVAYLEGVINIFNSRSFTLNSLLNYYAKNKEILDPEDLLSE